MTQMLWEHKFRDGSAVCIINKEFKEAKRPVPHFQFRFKHRGKNMVVEAPLFDRHDGSDLLESMYKKLMKYMRDKGVEEEPEQEVKLQVDESTPFAERSFKAKTCIKCKREFIPDSPAQKHCKFCMKSPEELNELENTLNEEADNNGQS